jgi:4,4'-diaponeurosporenoate glycosyltransferase
MDLFFWIFIGLSLPFWVFGWIVAGRFRTVPIPEVREGEAIPKISILIPARDEEENLQRLLPSIASQGFSQFEIIVMDDQSTDRTAEIAVSHGAQVLSGKPLPEGWYGKPWACQQGADAAKGDWFLFLDADTALEADGLQKIAGLTKEENAVHSICPYHRVEKPYEELSAFFNVVMLLGMNAFSLRGDQANGIGLFGQALLISREQYESVGGHEPVKQEVLENFHLARPLARAGYQCRCYLGKGTIWMRMFPTGLGDLVRGWSKGFVSGADNTPKGALIGISFWLSGLIMSVIALSFLPLAGPAVFWAILGFYVICAIQTLYLIRHAGSYSVLSAILFPIGLIFYQGLFFRALINRNKGGATQWKGRDVA